MPNVTSKHLAILALVCTSACVYQAQPRGEFDAATVSVTLSHVRSGQPTTVHLQAINTTGPAADLEVSLQARPAAGGDVTTFALGLTDANGNFDASWSQVITGAQEMFAIIGVLKVGKTPLPTDPVDVTVYASTPAFAITENDPRVYVAGSTAPFTLRALDASDSNATTNPNLAATDPNFMGVVAFSSDANNFSFPTVTFTPADNGEKDITNLVVTRTPTQTLTAYQQDYPSISASHAFTVDASVATGIVISLPAGTDPNAIPAGSSVIVTMTPVDTYGNDAPVTWASVSFSFTQPGSGIAPSIPHICVATGICRLSFPPSTAGGYTFTASGITSNGSTLNATPLSVVVVPASATAFAVTPTDANVRAGVSADFTVSAIGAQNNVIDTYTGSVTFTSTDSQAQFPRASYSFTPADNGTHSFTQAVTFNTWVQTPTRQVLTVTDTAQTNLAGTTSFFVAGNQNYYTVTLNNSPVTVDTPLSITVSAYDANGILLTSPPDQFNVSVTDTTATVMSNSDLLHANPNTFPSAVQFKHPATASLTITDATSSTNIRAITTQSFTVSPGAAFSFTGTPNATTLNPNQGASITYVAYDKYSNVAAGYNQTLSIVNSDSAGTPASGSIFTFVNGQVTVPVSFATSGGQSIVAKPNGFPNITTTFTIQRVATKFAFARSNPATAGGNIPVIVSAQDATNTVITNYSGKVSFTSSDTTAILPATYSYTVADAGAHTFGIIFKQAGTQTFTATDTITGVTSPAAFTVVAGAAATTKLSPQAASACGIIAVNANVLDAYGNTVSNANTITVTPYLPGLNAAPQSKTTAAGAAVFTFFVDSPGVASFVAASPLPGSAFNSVSAVSPTLAFVSSSGTGGCVRFNYTISGVCNPNVLFSYSLTGTDPWNPATLSPSSPQGIYGMQTADHNTGLPLTLGWVWDSSRDLPNYTGNVVVRMSYPGSLLSQTLSVNLANGANFATGTSTVSVSGAGTFAVGDADHKNFDDVVFGSGQTLYVSLNGLASNTNMTLNADANYKVRNGMVTASFSNDGNTQVLVCTTYATDTSRNALLGYSYLSGSFRSIAVSPGTLDCNTIAALDYDLDGDLDLAVLDSNGTTRLYRNNGSTSVALSFGSSINIGNTGRARIIVRDFNVDGYPDVLGIPADGNSIDITYTGSTIITSSFQVALTGPLSADVADFDRDSALDLLVATGTHAYVYPGVHQTPTQTNSPFNASGNKVTVYGTPILAADVDGDGHADIVSSSGAGNPLGVGLTAMVGGLAVYNAPTTINASFPGAVLGLSSGQIRLPNAPRDLLVNTSSGLSLITNTRAVRCNATIAAPRDYLDSATIDSAVADINLDNKFDAVTLHSNNVTLYSNAGDGTLSTSSVLSFTASASALALMDLDADGKVDIVTTTGDGNLNFFRNQNGTFGASTPFTHVTNATQIAPVRLFNPSGVLYDLATLTADGHLMARQNLSVAGNANITPMVSTALTQLGFNPRGMRITTGSPSFNNDNVPDFAFVDVTGKVVTYAGSQSGTLTYLSVSAANPNYVGIAVEDFDADGLVDVYGLTSTGSLYFLKTQSGTFTLGTASLQTTIPSCDGVSLASTTITDQKWLTVTCDHPPRTVLLQAGTSNLYNIPHATAAIGTFHDRTHFVDLNNDGQTDILVTNNNSGHMTTAMWDDTLVHQYQGADQNVPAPGGATGLALANFPNPLYPDGLLDAAVSDPNSPNGGLQLNGNGAGDFIIAQSIAGTYNGVETADFDHNGLDDGVFVANTKLLFEYYEGTAASGSLTLHQQPSRIAAPDLTNDTWPDIVAVKFGTAVFDYAINNKTASPFTGNANQSLALVGNIVSFSFGDINGDGYKDMVIGTSLRTITQYSFRTGAPVALGAITTGQYAAAQTLADINNDGVLELVMMTDQNVLTTCTYSSSSAFTCTAWPGVWPYAASDQLFAYDFTADGILDFAIPALGGSYVGFWVGGASPGYWGTNVFNTSPGQARVGDIDNDGRPDLSMSCNANNSSSATAGPGVTRTVFTGFSR